MINGSLCLDLIMISLMFLIERLTHIATPYTSSKYYAQLHKSNRIVSSEWNDYDTTVGRCFIEDNKIKIYSRLDEVCVNPCIGSPIRKTQLPYSTD